ncbi:putative late blight resistance protein homolog R1B-12 [Lycium ferocissimum]|uniref:putative late blight resistance protein homolog R1B-12 n=1 Tax=Lycium ferocissimum TaxID=112874 RepID=UPI0028156E7C|nr:putative late blight resistance protein homolog R1B-12 [Lycium ferocissimum]
MAEVAEIQDENVLPNTKDDPPAHTSSQFAKNPDMNEGTVGLMDVMNELRGKLTGGSSNLDVISIFGMPGVRKTTLANKLYLDQSVVSHFDIRAQVCVSQEYTRKDMLLTILGDLIGKNAKLDEEAENALADKLKQKLLRRRYLIFIDDIWHTSAWKDLWSCFQHDNGGSRIILTSRQRDVASDAKIYSDPFELLPLSSEKSWTLLKNKVFNEERCPPDLQNVGKKIAQKCCGLPLSIILVAGILTRMEKEEQCWEQVMTNLAQHIGTLSDYTIDLSYQNLPDHLKPCFLYFGLFSEDKEIQVSKLTWLWISEGFVTTRTEKLLEVVAKDYLENLVGRNLVIVAKKSFDGTIKTCRVDDLLFEFCTKKAKLNNFSERIKWDKGVDMSHVFPSKYRTPRLSLHSQCDNLQKWCSSFSHVKSFQFREARNFAFSSMDHASYTFRRFKFLRVLDIELTIIDSFPQELTLLKYLAFRTAEDAISLPAHLWNLEILIVQGIRGRVSLPNTIWKMVKLRHLHIYDQVFFTLDSGQELSESPSTMNALQTISSPCFSCVDNADKISAKTPNLQKLRCKVLKFDGSFPAFGNLTELEMLKISSGTRLTLTNQLKFPSKLKQLTVSNFHIDLTKVATLLELEVLKLLGVTISSNIWKVNDEHFLQLKFLKLEDPSFSEWHASGDAFPSLEHLVLERCRYLKVIPSRFVDPSYLKSVEIISCDKALAVSAEAVKGTLIDMSGTSGFEIFIRK